MISIARRATRYFRKYGLSAVLSRAVGGQSRSITEASLERKAILGACERPSYAYCIYHAALLARSLAYPRVSVIEFGVGTGTGLLSIERHVATVEEELGVGFDVYGFDTGSGLPEPEDYRDLPHKWRKGDYALDVARVEAKLTRARLVLGDVGETVPGFFQKYAPAPIACVFFDLDYYSSMIRALSLFDADYESRLPRVICQMDSIVGWDPLEGYSSFTSDQAAIDEFNRRDPLRKIDSVKFRAPWELTAVEPLKLHVFHDFGHPRYCDPVRRAAPRAGAPS